MAAVRAGEVVEEVAAETLGALPASAAGEAAEKAALGATKTAATIAAVAPQISAQTPLVIPLARPRARPRRLATVGSRAWVALLLANGEAPHRPQTLSLPTARFPGSRSATAGGRRARGRTWFGHQLCRRVP